MNIIKVKYNIRNKYINSELLEEKDNFLYLKNGDIISKEKVVSITEIKEGDSVTIGGVLYKISRHALIRVRQRFKTNSPLIEINEVIKHGVLELVPISYRQWIKGHMRTSRYFITKAKPRMIIVVDDHNKTIKTVYRYSHSPFIKNKKEFHRKELNEKKN